MAIVRTIPNAHMPFLFTENGRVQMLFTLPDRVITPSVDLAEISVLFRKPWLDDPKHDAARAKIAATNNIAPYPLWKTFWLDGLDAAPVPVIWPESTPDTVECSPIMQDAGGHQFVATLNRRSYPVNGPQEMELPQWASLPYGWSAPGLEVWAINDDVSCFGWQRDGGPLHTFRLVSNGAKSRLYRLVPIADDPNAVLVTTLCPPDDGRTFIVTLDDAPTVREVLVDGKPIYKSSILGSHCAFAIRRAGTIERDLAISDSFETVIPADIKLSVEISDELPSGFDMMKNFTASALAWAASGFLLVNKVKFDQRMNVCKACPFWEPRARFTLGKCEKCGCTKLKQWLVTERCPDGRW